jgi:hypothetical protein
MQALGWGFPAERLAWSAVEFGGDGVEGLRSSSAAIFLTGARWCAARTWLSLDERGAPSMGPFPLRAVSLTSGLSARRTGIRAASSAGPALDRPHGGRQLHAAEPANGTTKSARKHSRPDPGRALPAPVWPLGPGDDPQRSRPDRERQP